MFQQYIHQRQQRIPTSIWSAILCAVMLFGLALGVIVANRPVPALATTTTGFNGGKLDAGAAGTSRSYSHTLTNESGAPQTFTLSAASSKGFTVVATPPIVTLSNGQSTTVSVQVTIPNGTAPGILDVTTLTAANTPPAPPLILRVKDTTLASETTALKIPPLQSGQLVDGKRVYSLTAANSSTEFWPGVQTPTSGYNGSYLGPTLVMTTSETVAFSVTNNLTETTTTHWHGLHLPPEMDGGPHQMIEPGMTWSPSWTVQNEASTMWYHPHPHPHETSHAPGHSANSSGSTGSQVYQGLAGMIIIRDAASNALGLPQRYGVDEFPLVFQDRMFNADGTLKVTADDLGHRKGDAFLVNGTLAGHLEVPAQLVRLHLLNGSNFRFFSFGFSDNRSFAQIASDDALLNAPVQRTRVQLAPGERIEIVVDLSNAQGQTIQFANYSEELGDTLVPNHTADDFDRWNYVLFSLHVTAPTANPVTSIPGTLNTIARLNRSDAGAEHRLVLQIPPSINGNTFEMNVVNITSTLNTIEVWSIANMSDEPHPIHIHGSPFQILLRDAPPFVAGQPLPPGGVLPPVYELGWKDTVIVKAGERVDLIRGSYDFADLDSPFMYHCHLLEHEDHGMMGQFVAVRKAFVPQLMR
jgi:FtsP/CotA-like multicopper oxidase with cupredoxin domain